MQTVSCVFQLSYTLPLETVPDPLELGLSRRVKQGQYHYFDSAQDSANTLCVQIIPYSKFGTEMRPVTSLLLRELSLPMGWTGLKQLKKNHRKAIGFCVTEQQSLPA